PGGCRPTDFARQRADGGRDGVAGNRGGGSMGLMYYPKQGEILLCNYNTGFVAPEMTKIRLVVIVSPRLRRRADLVAVVPLSTTPPVNVEPHHCRTELA